MLFRLLAKTFAAGLFAVRLSVPFFSELLCYVLLKYICRFAAFLTVNLRFQLTRRKRPMDRTGEKKIMPALWQAGQMYHILQIAC